MTVLLALCFYFPSHINAQDSSPNLQDTNTCDKDTFYDCSTCSCDLSEPAFATIIFVFQLLCFILSIVFIIGFSSVKMTQKHNGIIVIILLFGNIIYSLNSFVTAFNHFANKFQDLDNTSLCTSLGYFNYLIICLTYLYQISFFSFTVLPSKNRRGSRLLSRRYHVVPIAVTFISALIFHFQDGFGRTVYGTCELKTSMNILTPAIQYGTLVIISLILLIILRKRLWEESDASRMTKYSIRYHLKYLFVCCLFYIAIGAMHILIADSATDYGVEKKLDLKIFLLVMGIFITSLQAVNPFIILKIWINDPKSYKYFKSPLEEYRTFSCIWSQNFEFSLTDTLEDDDTYDTNRDFLIQNGTEIDEGSRPRTQMLNTKVTVKDIKLNIVFTMILSVKYYWYMLNEDREIQIQSDSSQNFGVQDKSLPLRPEKVSDRMKVSVETIYNEIPDVVKEISKQNHQVLEGSLTMYGINSFREIIGLDDIESNLKFSFEINKNIKKMTKGNVSPDGNKGFLFSTFDNKYVFKSISEKQLNTLVKILPNYIRHLKACDNSLMARIYGAFTYEVAKQDKKIHFVIMSNVNKYLPHNTVRSYELKGIARFRRTVMDDVVERKELRYCGILKDYDFNRFEGSIKVGDEIRFHLLRILKRDIEFLMTQGLTDYNLCLHVSSRNRMPSVLSTVSEAEEILEFSLSNGENVPLRHGSAVSLRSNTVDMPNEEWEGHQLSNPYAIIEGHEENVDYMIGIIDFFDQYDMKTRFEIFLRNIGFSIASQTLTVEKPSEYGQRLIDYLDKIIE